MGVIQIGPSTGWLYAKGIYPLAEQKIILESAGANSIEVFLDSWGIDDGRMLSLRKGSSQIQGFNYRSLHLPDIRNQGSGYQISLARYAADLIGATVALTHPLKIGKDYPTEYYKRMISHGIPLAIENMDARKENGFKLKELEKLVANAGCRFVLDVQHAFEHDPGMKYAEDLLWSFWDRLVHLHVSGETENNNHSLVHKARNAKAIVDFIGRVLSLKNVPLILEGEYATSDELRREIEFLEKELDFETNN